MIPNPGYLESGPQPLFLPQPSPPPPPPPRGEACTSPIPDSTQLPLLLASLVYKVPRSPHPPPHRAP